MPTATMPATATAMPALGMGRFGESKRGTQSADHGGNSQTTTNA
jgi:hypothetical protein